MFYRYRLGTGRQRAGQAPQCFRIEKYPLDTDILKIFGRAVSVLAVFSLFFAPWWLFYHLSYVVHHPDHWKPLKSQIKRFSRVARQRIALQLILKFIFSSCRTRFASLSTLTGQGVQGIKAFFQNEYFSMIIHYLASNPNFIPFFLMGFTVALGFSFWGSAKQGCLIGALYVYVFGVWLFVCLIFIFSYSSGQEFFIFGILAYHIKTIFSWLSTAFFWILEKSREWKQAEEKANREKEQAQGYQHQQNHQQQDRAEQVRREQERREREARQYREQQERARREQEQAQQKSQQQHQRQEKRQEPPPKQEQKRTPYEILGIQEGASMSEIEKAFKLESNRTHPDKWINKPQYMKKMMEEEYRQIIEAYRVLKPKPPPTKDERVM